MFLLKFRAYVFHSLLLFLGLLSSCVFSDVETNKAEVIKDKVCSVNQDRFVIVSQDKAMGTQHIESWYVEDENYVAIFLAKLWCLFGEPQYVGFEGFAYTIQDIETGLIFTAYCAGSGPSFGGHYEDLDKLKSVLVDFETLLNSTPYAHCEIEYDTDFGRVICGASRNNPYMRMK